MVRLPKSVHMWICSRVCVLGSSYSLGYALFFYLFKSCMRLQYRAIRYVQFQEDTVSRVFAKHGLQFDIEMSYGRVGSMSTSLSSNRLLGFMSWIRRVFYTYLSVWGLTTAPQTKQSHSYWTLGRSTGSAMEATKSSILKGREASTWDAVSRATCTETKGLHTSAMGRWLCRFIHQ